MSAFKLICTMFLITQVVCLTTTTSCPMKPYDNCGEGTCCVQGKFANGTLTSNDTGICVDNSVDAGTTYKINDT